MQASRQVKRAWDRWLINVFCNFTASLCSWKDRQSKHTASVVLWVRRQDSFLSSSLIFCCCYFTLPGARIENWKSSQEFILLSWWNGCVWRWYWWKNDLLILSAPWTKNNLLPLTFSILNGEIIMSVDLKISRFLINGPTVKNESHL